MQTNYSPLNSLWLIWQSCEHRDIKQVQEKMKTKLVQSLYLLVLTSTSLSLYAASNDDFDFSVHLRENATYASAINFDKENPLIGLFYSQRLALDGKYRINDNWQVEGRLLSALQLGKRISPIERNNLDIQIGLIKYTQGATSIQFGRQEAKFGAQRLLGTRDGTNVRRVWDGIRWTQGFTNDKKADFFALQLVDVEPNGIFNDSSNGKRKIYGAYSQLLLLDTNIDLYLINHKRTSSNSIEGVGRENRTSIGARLSADREKYFWDWEVIYQFGNLGESEIDAWTLATNTGYRFESERNWEAVLSMNIASGDKRIGDSKLGTLNGLYPRGNYFSEASILGPSNFYNFHPYLRFEVIPSIQVTVDLNFYWRLERADGVYGPSGNLIRRPNDSTSHFVNLALSTRVVWNISDKLNANMLFTHSKPQDFLKESGVADTTNYVEINLDWHF